MRQDNEEIVNRAKQLSNVIQSDLTKFNHAREEIHRQIGDFNEMKKQLDEIHEDINTHFNYAKSHNHTLDEFIKMKDKKSHLWKTIKAVVKRYDDSRMTSMHVMHQSILSENEKLKEKLDETICEYDDIENDRDETKIENDRLHEEIEDLRADLSSMTESMNKLNSGSNSTGFNVSL